MSDTNVAGDVFEAVSRVMRDMPGIGKERHNTGEKGINYAFRGIDQITEVLKPLLASHRVVIVPRVVAWVENEMVLNGNRWTEQRIQVEYDVYGPGGKGDMFTFGPIPGIARDNSDKGSNKALTQAWKYALTQLFCIGDSAGDSDAVTPPPMDMPKPVVVKATPVVVLRSDQLDLKTELAKIGKPVDRANIRARFVEDGLPAQVADMSEDQVVRAWFAVDAMFPKGAQHGTQTVDGTLNMEA